MSSSSIKYFTCDRCGATETDQKPKALYEWGHIKFSQWNGPMFSSTLNGRKDHDVCPKCIGEVHIWWNALKGTW